MKILFLYQGLITFIERDLKILQSVHQVRELRYQGLKNVPSIISGILWADLSFSWFGKLHAFWAVFFSKLVGKKSVVVAGGDDVAHVPSIKYGMFAYWWKKWCPLFVFKHADLIFPVSNYNLQETIENAGANPTKVKLLYHGFDGEKWKRVDGVSKETLVLTVGQVTNETFRKKGLDLFVRSAAYLPDVPFVLVGPWHDNAIDRLRAIASPNVTFTGGLYGEDLIRIYSQAKVYVQVSIHESFGCSLAEAMLCECLPVVSRRAALPEVVGDCGFYVDELNAEAVAIKIKKVLSLDCGPKVRERIMQEFPLEKRQGMLLRAVNEVKRD